MELSEHTARLLVSDPGSDDFLESTRVLAADAFSNDHALAAQATQVIFSQIIEPWADSFDPLLCERYLVFMAELLLHKEGPIRENLKKLGYLHPQQLINRYRCVSDPSKMPNHTESVRKVLILSRVTLGADIAVTSTVVGAARRAFPDASIDFIGGKKNAAFFAGDKHVHHKPVSYGRGALLGERLSTWIDLQSCVEKCLTGLEPEKWIVLDPDSRLTQLGLLPIANDDSYRFFESRSYQAESRCNLSRLASDWCHEVLPSLNSQTCRPYIKLSDDDMNRGEQLRANSHKALAAVSFGVGGRESKRLDSGFEDSLLKLLHQKGFRILLDYGAGEQEAQLVEGRISTFQGTVSHFGADNADLITWQGSLSGFGGLAEACNIFVGYDSAAAHLAAALGVPVIDIFAGAASDRMCDRWTPAGPAPVHVIPVDQIQDRHTVLVEVDRTLPR